MIEAAEGSGGGRELTAVVRRFHRIEGVDVQVLFEDLEQIRALVAYDNEDHVLDVMELVIGDCRPEERIGPYQWGDHRNVFYRRHKAGKPLSGPG